MMPSPQELHNAFGTYADTAAPVLRLDDIVQGHRSLGRACIAIGAFDGVHRGHRALLADTVADARARGIRSYAVTFDPDPDCVLPGTPAPKLMGSRERLHALAHAGADGVFVIPFTHELASLDYRAFFADVLGGAMDIASINVGSDFRLGRQGLGTVDAITAWGRPRGIAVEPHELVMFGGQAVTATRIRAELAAGHVECARDLLGRPYAVSGSVATGRGEGSDMGFPTANLVVPTGIQVPADGVYEGIALVGDTTYPAAVNVGLPPTYADDAASAHLEANLIGFSGDLYGRSMALAFTRFLRPSRVFDSLDELIETVEGNIHDVIDDLGDRGVKLS